MTVLLVLFPARSGWLSPTESGCPSRSPPRLWAPTGRQRPCRLRRSGRTHAPQLSASATASSWTCTRAGE